jgi:hypothetical protein
MGVGLSFASQAIMHKKLRHFLGMNSLFFPGSLASITPRVYHFQEQALLVSPLAEIVTSAGDIIEILNRDWRMRKEK